ncbi:MAG: hypothetical protein J6Q15_00120, partial [Clostridia bacterium]|nr:hypothetical protein [Clostridia bacterium]
GYEFKGWNTKADGSGTKVTSFNGSVIPGTTYYAIYAQSNPTTILSATDDSIKYNEKDVILSLDVTNEGLTASSIKSYRWYVKGPGQSSYTLIEGATEATYTHIRTNKVGIYSYYAEVQGYNLNNKWLRSTAVTITVEKADTIASVTMNDFQYDNEESFTPPTLTHNRVEGEPVSVTYYISNDNSTWNEVTGMDLWAFINVYPGNYYIYAVITESDNYNAVTTETDEYTVAEGSFITTFLPGHTINGTEITESKDGNIVTGYSAVYNGGRLSASVITSVPGVSLQVWRDGDDPSESKYYTIDNDPVEIANITEVGSVTYHYSLVLICYEEVTGTITLTITQSAVDVQWEGLDGNYIYDGTDQSSKVKAYIIGANDERIDCGLTFKLDNSVTEFKNGGSYTVTAALSDTSYSLNADTITKTVTMNKRSAVIGSNDASITYGDTSVEYSHTETGVVDADKNSYTVSYAIYDGETDVTANISTLDVGTYKIKAIASTLSTDNYDVMYTASGTLTVNPYDLANATIENIIDQTYTGSALAPTPKITALGIELIVGTHFTYSYNSNINVGVATITITAKNNTNYTGSKSATFNIVAKEVEVPTATTTSFVYNGSVQTLNIPANSLYTISGNTGTNVKEYTATISLKDKSNYAWPDGTTSDKTIDWEITKADVTLSMASNAVVILTGATKTNVVTLDYPGSITNT